MDGLLLIDKPKNWTSFDIVAKVRGIVRAGGIAKPKVGHTGTLDPQATGLLVLTLGRFCKRAQEFSKLDKDYNVTLRLGETSTTDDNEGILTQVSTHQPNETAVRAAIEHFIGDIQQVPPPYSAIKVGGQRAYTLARAGQVVKLEARQVTIYAIENVVYDYPVVSFTAKVSSGTYIRSLARDIGERLNTGAYMSDLRRISIGDFKLVNALAMANLDFATINKAIAV